MKTLTVIRAIFIFLFTALCAVAGILLLLVTWNPKLVMYLNGKYLWSPVVLLASGVKLKVAGIERIDTRANCIYVSNHESLYDIVAALRASPVPLFFIAKKELKKIPFMGWYMQAIGMVFIDRQNRELAMQSMQEAGEKIKRGRNVISYPEGTRTKTGETGIFKRGTFVLAKSCKIPIQPFAISGAREVTPSGSFMIRPGTIHVNFGRPVYPHEYENMEADELAAFVRDIVLALKAECVN